MARISTDSFSVSGRVRPWGKIQLCGVVQFALLNAETSITLVQSLCSSTASQEAIAE
ncbi:MAG: hypothetical protein ACOCR6_00030 [archaeon]